MSKFNLITNRQGQQLQLQMNGVIDEDVDFSNHTITNATQIEIDLNNVKSINSCGIREWIKWLSTAKEAKISFKQCPKVIVDQMNMVDGFLPQNAQVESFFVPYYSDASGEEKNVLFRQGIEFSNQGSVQAPVIQDSKGTEMEMDVIESKYFKFIKK